MTKATTSRRLQVSLLTILLLIAAVAVWLAWFQSGQELQRMNTELINMKTAARELVVDDPSKYAIVSPHQTKFGENIWHVYVPKGAASELCVFMGDVKSQNSTKDVAEPGPSQSLPLPPGQHTLELIYERGSEESDAVLVVTMDEKEVLHQTRDWETGSRRLGGNQFSSLRTKATDARVILFDMKYETRAKPQPDVVPGIKLWIEPAAQ